MPILLKYGERTLMVSENHLSMMVAVLIDMDRYQFYVFHRSLDTT